MLYGIIPKKFLPNQKNHKDFSCMFFFLTVLVQLWFVLSSFSTAWVPCFCVYLAVLASCVTRSSLLPWATFALFFKIKRQYRHGPVCRPMTSLPVGTPIPRPAEQRTTGSLKVRWCVTPQNLPFAFQVVAAIPDPLRFHGNVASACQFLKKKEKENQATCRDPAWAARTQRRDLGMEGIFTSRGPTCERGLSRLTEKLPLRSHLLSGWFLSSSYFWRYFKIIS